MNVKTVVTLLLALSLAVTVSAAGTKEAGYKAGAGAAGMAHKKRSQVENKDKQPADDNKPAMCERMCDISKGKCKPEQKPESKAINGKAPVSGAKEAAAPAASEK